MSLIFNPVTLPPAARAMRARIRDFLTRNPPPADAARRANCWSVADAAYSRALGRAGFIGLTWPRAYGGAGATVLERYVVQEELLAAGAPVGMHWIADRQTGALLLRFGSDAQRQTWLPPMARGEVFTCIGMSEPGAGSDLAAVRTRASRVEGGWRLSGQKLWTSNAQHSRLMVTLARTGLGSERQAGLSQFLVDLTWPGITLRPILDLAGVHSFNEVFFDDVFVPDSALLGRLGEGWAQVTAELALERSGPERYLSSFALLVELLRAVGPAPDDATAGMIGRAVAELWTLRNMSLGVAARIAAGEEPVAEAAVVKDLGNAFEQALPRLVQAGLPADFDLAAHPQLAGVLGLLLQVAPSFSLRGGTREILRGIVARALGLR